MPDREDYLWDPAATPDAEIARLEAALRPLRYQPAEAPPEVAAPAPVRRVRPGLLVALAASVLIAVVGSELLPAVHAPWTVTSVRGAVSAGGAPLSAGASALRPGEWVETDPRSSATINVGVIGQAELGPGSRARLVRAQGTEHRMALQYGTLHARIWAPPRFFLVETPSALAVDLGCVYTLRLDRSGRGTLRVESGQVELVEGDLRVVVLAGNETSITPGLGPGIPHPVDATDALRAAVAAYELRPDQAAVAGILRAAEPSSSITLWYLLQRVPAPQRAAVYDRLTQLAPVPAGATREATLALDRRALGAWRLALAPAWTPEPVPAYKRMWRSLWGG